MYLRLAKGKDIKPEGGLCDRCTLANCNYVSAEGFENTGGLAIVGEAPGNDEVRYGKPFVGASGKLLNKILLIAGINRNDCFITNSVLCRPEPHRTPSTTEVMCCVGRLYKELETVRPRLILALGRIAAKAVLGSCQSIEVVRGTISYSDRLQTYVLVTYHPAHVLRNPKLYSILVSDIEKAAQFIKSGKVETHDISIQYEVIETPEQLKSLLSSIERVERIAVDVESGKDGQLLCVGLSVEHGKAYVVSSTALTEKTRKVLGNYFKNRKCIGQNIKFDMRVLWHNGIYGVTTGGDTLLQAYVLDTTIGGHINKHGLKTLVKQYLNFHEDYSAPVKKYNSIGYEHCPPDVLFKYNATDAVLTLILYDELQKRLDAQDNRLLEELLYPASDALAEMEHCGIMVDVDYLNQLNVQLEKELQDLITQMQTMAGYKLNPNSYHQLVDLLFNKFELPIPLKGLVTDEESLKLIAEMTGNEFVKLLLHYRDRKKFHSTYVLGLLKARDENNRVHTNFNLNVTATGRLSSSRPVNLQNITKGSEARNIFIATPGYKLIECDLSQAEVRVWAILSRDEVLRKNVMSGLDMHISTACLMFGKKPEEVTKQMRDAAKRFTFGVMYGKTAQSLASDLNISLDEAQHLMDKFFEAYSRGKEWIHEMQELALEQGFIVTPFGRKLRFIITPENRSKVMRQAVNYPIQSTASDITLASLIRIHRRIKAGEFGNTRLLLTVHDSIILETTENEKEVALAVKTEMEKDIFDGWLPIVADTKVGVRWGELQALE